MSRELRRIDKSWPLFIVAVGETMVWKEVFRRGSRVHEKVE